MDSITTALLLMTKECWMASQDLKDAYYSVSIGQGYQKYPKFILVIFIDDILIIATFY